MTKHQHDEDPKIEDFVKRTTQRRRTGRRSITLWLDGGIIDACKPKPAQVLRQWIEDNFTHDR